MKGSKKHIRFERSDWKLLLLQLLLTGMVLCVFALFHHVLPEWELRRNGIGDPIGVVRPSMHPAEGDSDLPEAEQAEAAASGEEQAEDPSELEEPEDPETDASVTVAEESIPWRIRFEEHFSDSPVAGENYYSSPNLSVTITEFPQTEPYPEITYYVADIYIADITCLRSAKPSRGAHDAAVNIAAENDAVLAINGDSALNQRRGILVRNGLIYGDSLVYGDLCILRYDGVMETFAAGSYTAEDILQREPYQSWQFGPSLLDENGEPKEKFETTPQLSKRNPRTAIGYYEPGHYCFVVVDGRHPGYSVGAEMNTLARIMHDLGCRCAYNLDGGASSMMVLNGEIANHPYSASYENIYRAIGDMILITEPTEEGGET